MNIGARFPATPDELEQLVLTTWETSKFIRVPQILANWMADHGGLTGKSVLDFGCGGGMTAAGVALTHGACVDGVDINAEAADCPQWLKDILGVAPPENLNFRQIAPGEQLSGGPYDLVYSWSVFEHVNTCLYDKVVNNLFDRLKPGGHMFVQISPLFFSPEGSHLWAIGFRNWEHLTKQTSDVLADIETADLADRAKQELTDMYCALNRVTADDLVSCFCAAGFELVRERRDRVDLEPSRLLLNAYTEAALKTNQIVTLFQRPV